MTRIADLAVTDTFTPSDVLIISDGQLTKKITVDNFKTSLLNVATRTRPGIIRAGAGLEVSDQGVLSVRNYSAYTLPTATNNELGGIKVGDGLEIDAGGVLSATYTLPAATSLHLGGVIIGDGLLIENGVVSVDASEKNSFPQGLYAGTSNELKIYVAEAGLIPKIQEFTKGILDLSVVDSAASTGFAGVRLISSVRSSSLSGGTTPALIPANTVDAVNLGLSVAPWDSVYANNFYGNFVGSIEGTVTGSHNGNLIADDSTVAFNSATGIFTGTFNGPIAGNATSASQLQVSRKINNVFFNGTADITVYDSTKVDKAGDTMTGPLTLSDQPVGPMHAAAKSYVDTVAAQKLNLTGGTLSGFLTLSDAPQQGLHAATKDYVDGNILTRLPLTGGTLTGSLTLANDPSSPLHSATKRYVDYTADAKIAANNIILRAYVDQQDALKLNLTGGTMTGRVTLSANPIDNLHAATKQYVDAADTVQYDYTTAEILSLRSYTDAGLLTEHNYTDSVTTALDSSLRVFIAQQDALKLSLTGGTMTGRVTLSANPIDNLHAATKQYVDAADTNLDTTLKAYTDAQIAALSYHDTFALGVKSPLPTAFPQRSIRGFSAYNSTDFPGQFFGGLTVSGPSNVQSGQLAFNWNSEESAPSGLYFRVNDDTGTTTEWSAWSQISTTQYVDTATTNLNNALRGYIDSRDNTKLNLSGGTMTGALSLYAHPTSTMHAATKFYVDSTRPAQVHATYGSTDLYYYSSSYFDVFPPVGYTMSNLIAFMPAFATTGSAGSYYYDWWWGYNYYWNYNNGTISWSALGDRVRVYLSGNYYYYYYYYYNNQRINWMAIWR